MRLRMKKSNVLSVDQIEFACDSFKKWLKICEANNKHISISGVEDSWLLRRILSGKDPLVDKPPERFGMPAWELIDRDEIEIESFDESDKGISIDEHSGYSWVDKSKKHLKYDRLNLHYELIEKEQQPNQDFVDDDIESYKYTAKFLKKLSK